MGAGRERRSLRVIAYSSSAAYRALGTDMMRVEGTIRRIAEGTDTSGLVVLVHLSRRTARWGGVFYSSDVSLEALRKLRGPWREVHGDGVPPGLPSSFPLIEVSIGAKRASYPLADDNRNGFRIECASFHDHLAYIFAHELHHYRRYKLGMHHREGEKSADKWAVVRARTAGYFVNIQKSPVSRRAGMKGPPSEHWRRVRALKEGSLLLLAKSDNRRLPAGSRLQFIRAMRGSYRVLCRDTRGDERVVPIDWVRIIEEE